MAQLQRRSTDSQFKELIERYLRVEIQRDYIQEIPGMRKTQFFALMPTLVIPPSMNRNVFSKTISALLSRKICPNSTFKGRMIWGLEVNFS